MMKLHTVYSATLALAVERLDPEALKRCGAKKTEHWRQGAHQPTRTLRPELPRDLSAVWGLLRGTYSVAYKRYFGVPRWYCPPMAARFEAEKASQKIAATLGLPAGNECPADETAFLRAIAVAPGDVTLWLVYADWLDECEGGDEWPHPRARASLIRQWAGARYVHAKEGVASALKKTWLNLAFSPPVSELLGHEKPIPRPRRT